MELNGRQREILAITNEKQKVTVKHLADTLFFSEMTIRRDLIKMEQGGYLKRYHGGALSIVSIEYRSIGQRMCMNEKEKREMARCAERHLKDRQTVLLPGCSTCAYLIPHLKSYNDLHVVTNSTAFLEMLSEMGIKCTICGGEYYAPDKTVVGPKAYEMLLSINYDVAFFSCDGIDDDGTVSVKNEASVDLLKVCFKNAKKRILIADHSKLHQRKKYNCGNTHDADEFIMQMSLLYCKEKANQEKSYHLH